MADPRVKVILDADDRASSIIQTLGDNMGKVFAAGALTAVTAEWAQLGKEVIQTGEAFALASQKFGVGTEFLSGLKYTGGQLNVEFDALQKGLKFLNREISAAASGNPEAEATFHALGISVRDANGQIRPTEQVFRMVADRLSTVRDGADKTAVMLKLFGRAGSELIPIIDQGSAGLDRFAAEAAGFGLVLDDKTSEAMKNIAEDMKKLGAQAEGAATQFMAGLTPGLDAVLRSMLSLHGEVNSFKAAGQWVSDWGVKAVGVFFNLAFGVREVVEGMALLNESMKPGFLQNKDRMAFWTQDLKDVEATRLSFIQNLLNDRPAGPALPQQTATLNLGGGAGGGSSLFAYMSQSDMDKLRVPKTDQQKLAEATSWVNALTAGDKQLRDMLSIPSPFVTWAEQAKDLGDQVQISFQDMQIGEEQVRAAVARGDLDQMTGAQKIIELHKEWAASVQQILPEYERLAALTGDQGLQMNVKGLAAQVEDLSRESSALGMHLKGVLVDDMSRAFADWISGTTSAADAFRRMAQDIIGQLVEIIAKMVLVKALQGIGGGLFGGIGELLGFAEGGPFQAGVPFLAGEQGPELIVPSVGGTVLNQAQLGMNPQGAGGNVTVHINAPGADADAARRIEGVARQLRAEMPLYAAATFKEMRRRGVNF